MDEKKAHTKALKELVNLIVINRVQVNCIKRASVPDVSAALDTMRSLLLRLETGRESKEVNLNVLVLLKKIIKNLPAVALTNYKTLDYVPGADKDFDLVLIDDASQEGFELLPLILKGEKVVVSGDERMYAPQNRYPVANFDVFKSNFLVEVPIFLYEMITPSSSLLDVATSLFYQDKVYLSENVRSESDIFDFVNDNYYENSLTALKATNLSVDSSLVDVFIKDSNHNDDINEKESNFIISEILNLVKECESKNLVRTIGVITLSSPGQACFIEERLQSLLPISVWKKHKIAVGITETSQGRERDVVFISVGSSYKNKDRALSSDNLKLAMTRAKETVYLVHGIKVDDLGADNKGLKVLLSFFHPKIAVGEFTGMELVNQCKSEVEKNIMAYLLGREFSIKPNVNFGKFSVDLMVFDDNTNLAIDVEGDVKEQSYCWKNSVKRQLELEEVGWNFYRVLYSQYCSSRTYLLDSIVKKLDSVGMKAIPEEQGTVKKRIKMIVVDS